MDTGVGLVMEKTNENEPDKTVSNSNDILSLSEKELKKVATDMKTVEQVTEPAEEKMDVDQSIITISEDNTALAAQPDDESVVQQTECDAAVTAESEQVVLEPEALQVVEKTNTEPSVLTPAQPDEESVVQQTECDAAVTAESEQVVLEPETLQVVEKTNTEPSVLIPAQPDKESVVQQTECDAAVLATESEQVVFEPETQQVVEQTNTEPSVLGGKIKPLATNHFSTNENTEEQPAIVKITQPSLEDMIQLPQSLKTSASDSLSILEQDSTDLAIENDFVVRQTTDILQEATKKIEPNKWKPKSGSFSLGVPGLTFSAQNLKIASDGTKMVQIHQSQITPTQLAALQANPNIKVVFRHIPSGKSFTKPPKNLFSSSQKNGVKRKHDEDEQGLLDDSVYNFDDFDDDSSYDMPPKPKVPHLGTTKSARYNPNVGMKRKAGRPKSFPDSSPVSSGLHSKPVLPTHIQLTDALVKLNKPGAKCTVKVHVKQVSHDILINMELDPKYNIVLTAKHEVAPEHSLEELVKEWEEKEMIEQPEEKDDSDARKEEQPLSAKPQTEKIEVEEKATKKEKMKKQIKVVEKERDEQSLLRVQQRQQKEKEEELFSTSLLETKSRSGRIRKPTRYSLDIARMIKRRSVVGDQSPDEERVGISPKRTQVSSAQRDKQTIPKTTEAQSSSPEKRRGRGRPRKEKKVDKDAKETASPPRSAEPRVIMSPSDKRLADMRLMQAADKSVEEPAIVIEEDNEKSKKVFIDEPSEVAETSADLPEESTEEVKGKIQEKETEKKSSEKEESQKSTDQTKEKASESSKEEDEVISAIEQEDAETPMEVLESNEQSSAVAEKAPSTSTNEKEENASEINEQSSVVAEKAPSTSTNEKKESPSEILARKLSQDGDKPDVSEVESAESENTSIKDFVEEEGDVDNKYRLRRLLQQCSVEEIRTVAIPKALEIISLGDFFLHKAGQMATKNVSFMSLYKQVEDLHTCVEKESARYSTLLRRANKVGGDRRMEKVILMPVYNKQAAESLGINSSSIDAHIGGIYQKPTTHMIAANSFRMSCKMTRPVHRLKLPELNDQSAQARRKRSGAAYTQANISVKQGLADAKQTFGVGRPRGSWKRGYQVRKPNYLLGEQSGGGDAMTLQEHARLQAASRYQPTIATKESAVADTSNLVNNVTAFQVTTTANQTASGDVQLVTTELPTAMTTQTDTVQSGTELVTEETATIVQAEDGKQLVSIGDGQYVELPEGYTLLQTDDGYIIGQPGATFVQGEDGNVYMTSTEEGTSELADQVLTTTATINEPQPEEQILEELPQT